MTTYVSINIQIFNFIILLKNPYYNFLSFLTVRLKVEISETTGQKFLMLGLFERQVSLLNDMQSKIKNI